MYLMGSGMKTDGLSDRSADGRKKSSTDGPSEERERDEGTTAKCPEAAVEDNKGKKRESRITVINNTRFSCTAVAPDMIIKRVW